MTDISQDSMCSSFTPFPRLPTELRLKIWYHVYHLTPPQIIPFYLCKSDLDYLRLKRKACHDYPHIFAGKMKNVPPILHVCRESRSVGLEHYSLGFDILRILSLGRGDTDGDTYTTCSHEVTMDDQDRGIYWDRTKDVVFLGSSEWLDDKAAAYIWGGQTGIRFGRMRKVAMSYDTVISCGIGQAIQWESLDLLIVLMPEQLDSELDLAEERWVYRTNRESFVQTILKSRGLLSSEGDLVEVQADFRSLKNIIDDREA